MTKRRRGKRRGGGDAASLFNRWLAVMHDETGKPQADTDERRRWTGDAEYRRRAIQDGRLEVWEADYMARHGMTFEQFTESLQPWPADYLAWLEAWRRRVKTVEAELFGVD